MCLVHHTIIDTKLEYRWVLGEFVIVVVIIIFQDKEKQSNEWAAQEALKIAWSRNWSQTTFPKNITYCPIKKKTLLLLSASVNLCPPDSWREYQEKSYIQSPVSLVKNLPEAN